MLYTYDAEGRVRETTFPDLSVESLWYDPAGNVTQRLRGGVTTVQAFDSLGNLTSVTVGGLLTASNRYDQLGRQIWSQTAGEIDAFVHCVGTAASLRGIATVLNWRTTAS